MDIQRSTPTLAPTRTQKLLKRWLISQAWSRPFGQLSGKKEMPLHKALAV